jgi:hAT family C-terminal dimerisation region
MTTSSAPTTISISTELVSYASMAKSYSGTAALSFWINSETKCPILAPLAEDLISDPASEAHVGRVFSVCGDLTRGKIG